MGQKELGAYLDSGSLGLFVQQIMEILEGAVAVAIHDTDGRLENLHDLLAVSGHWVAGDPLKCDWRPISVNFE